MRQEILPDSSSVRGVLLNRIISRSWVYVTIICDQEPYGYKRSPAYLQRTSSDERYFQNTLTQEPPDIRMKDFTICFTVSKTIMQPNGL
jgi:hypothetical protein